METRRWGPTTTSPSRPSMGPATTPDPRVSSLTSPSSSRARFVIAVRARERFFRIGGGVAGAARPAIAATLCPRPHPLGEVLLRAPVEARALECVGHEVGEPYVPVFTVGAVDEDGHERGAATARPRPACVRPASTREWTSPTNNIAICRTAWRNQEPSATP